MKIEKALALVVAEHERAVLKFGAFASPHEGKAVIEEEFDELWLEIKHNKRLPDEYRAAMRKEAVQLSAMALRFLVDLT